MDQNLLYDNSKQKMELEELINLLKWYRDVDKNEIPLTLQKKTNEEVSDLFILVKTLRKAFYCGTKDENESK